MFSVIAQPMNEPQEEKNNVDVPSDQAWEVKLILNCETTLTQSHVWLK
jgi:hypothetical protein